MIKRELYLKQLKNYQDKPFIKVLTGLRRVGKSTIIDQFVNELIDSGVDKNNILKINFELPESFSIDNYQTLTNYVLSWSKNKKSPLYILLDEVGRVKEWEKAVNGFHAMNIFDIYITGSNADLLSSDLSTYLAGRYIEIKIYPLAYKEFIRLYPQGKFNDYIIFGGMPSIESLNLDYTLSMNILRDSFKSAVLQDVIYRYKIRNTVVLEKLIEYIFTNVGKTFSANSISNYFKSQKITVSVDTILSYLNNIEQAFLIHKVSRNDLIGKRVLKTEEKYYITDHGMREAVVGNNNAIIEMILENIVYLELLRRGFKVYVGKVNGYEIDFVAIKGSEKLYFQVAYLLASDDTIKREFGSLLAIKDQYPKYIITTDKFNMSQKGIIHKNIIDFLLE